MLKKNKITNLSKRKKKILFKCTHRGSKELDILLGSYVKKFIHSLTIKQLDHLDSLLSFDDIYLFSVLTKKSEIDPKMDKSLVKQIIKFNQYINKYD